MQGFSEGEAAVGQNHCHPIRFAPYLVMTTQPAYAYCNCTGRAWLLQCYGHVQVAGFVQHYDGLSYATVKGAGHMVGQGKPAEALSLIDRFLRGDSL